jgi:transcriptional regulator with XRE-family HTH domain
MGADGRLEILRRFGKRVRGTRDELGISQEELAARADLDRTYVGGVEPGERNVSLINFHRLAKALDLAAKDLL